MSSGTSPIGSPDSGNGVAITQAAARDMGILIISPFDKGGKLYEPSEQLVTACAPRVPLQYGALWIWNHEQIHTITIGAERPSDFHTHLDAAQDAGTADGAEYVQLVDTRLEALQNAAGFDEEWRSSWWHHLPSCFDVPGGVNVRLIVWMYTLFTSYGMLWYARARYATLENQTEKTKREWDWTHGTPGDKLRADLAALLRSSWIAQTLSPRDCFSAAFASGSLGKLRSPLETTACSHALMAVRFLLFDVWHVRRNSYS